MAARFYMISTSLLSLALALAGCASTTVREREVGAAAGARDTARAANPEERELTETYRRLLTAVVQHDTAALKRLLAPSYTFVPPRGDTVFTREQRLANEATDTTRASVVLQNCQSQVYGSAAVAHCRYTATVAGSDSTRDFISTVVFIRQGGRWQIVTTHPSVVRPR